jgi:transitional endoplasmic reticulum ATPase
MEALRRVLPHVDPDTGDIPPDVLQDLFVTQHDFDTALSGISPSALREVLVEKPNVQWEDIGGLERAKKALLESVEGPLRFPDVFEEMKIRTPKGILLYGPPGTGKTLLAKAVATTSEANFISIKGPEIFNKYVGESEKAVREIFKKARQVAPCVIFFDEIDALLSQRGQQDETGVSQRIVNQFLAEVDGLQTLQNVLVIGATNRPDIMDPALLRPGRFDILLHVEAPDEDARKEILNVHTLAKGIPGSENLDLEELAKKTANFSGADIEGLVRVAVMIAVTEGSTPTNIEMKARDIEMKHFEEALKSVRPTLTPNVMEYYEKISAALEGRQIEPERKTRSDLYV